MFFSIKNIKNLSPEEFAALLKEKDIVLIDCRTPQEFQAGHLPAAINIDFFQNFSEQAKKYINDWQEKKILIYCRSGHRSYLAARQLSKIFPEKEIYNLKGGIIAWQKHFSQ